MALIECRFYSEVLSENTTILVIIPTVTFEDTMQQRPASYISGARYQSLYLLHGLSDDCTSWVRNTSIERYAQERCLAVVMPATGKSFYADMVHGSRYWTFISEEVPKVARHLFPLSDKREDNFTAGVSMGGYGAFKLALRKPESFYAAASLSGAADLGHVVLMARRQPAMKRMLENIFGDLDSIAGSENDLLYLLKRLKNGNTEVPKLYQCCGTEDLSYPLISKFNEYLQDLGIEPAFESSPGGHTWEYWDLSIKRVLDWFPLRKAAV